MTTNTAAALSAVLPLMTVVPPGAIAPPFGRRKAKLLQVWDCVQMNHIWMPMSFIFVFAATPSNADAFANYILGPLCFSDAMYTYLWPSHGRALLGTFIYTVTCAQCLLQTLLCHAGHRGRLLCVPAHPHHSAQ